MSKRSPASLVRPLPHAFLADPGDPASCCAIVRDRRCALPQRNELHNPPPGATAAAAASRAFDARRTGEHDYDDGDDY